MNFTIDLAKLGEMSVLKILIIGTFFLLGLIIWRLPQILEQWHKFKS
ncbi:Uncharacterised protein [Moraxella caviae]|uniref:Uncharacterized protein n=1 Tax=Moraxella caviae TaxID=34060 RepID=A0A378R957_9GAMM|nr:Uncharacterised protein [Moraxella caviae]VEW12540.1 Uncharacterised protein [Moraxella caviae]